MIDWKVWEHRIFDTNPALFTINKVTTILFVLYVTLYVGPWGIKAAQGEQACRSCMATLYPGSVCALPLNEINPALIEMEKNASKQGCFVSAYQSCSLLKNTSWAPTIEYKMVSAK